MGGTGKQNWIHKNSSITYEDLVLHKPLGGGETSQQDPVTAQYRSPHIQHKPRRRVIVRNIILTQIKVRIKSVKDQESKVQTCSWGSLGKVSLPCPFAQEYYAEW